MPPQKHRIIQEAKFTYSPIGKEFEEQTKTVEKHDEKQVPVMEPLESPDKVSLLIKNFLRKSGQHWNCKWSRKYLGTKKD